jgi:hypothetical protein
MADEVDLCVACKWPQVACAAALQQLALAGCAISPPAAARPCAGCAINKEDLNMSTVSTPANGYGNPLNYGTVRGPTSGIVQASAPTANHDQRVGYAPGDFIIVGTALYFCADASTGAAVWKQLTNAS